MISLKKWLAVDVSESVEEYLEALWVSEEGGKSITKIDWVAKRLNIMPPSVVEMFRKLEKQGFVKYYPHQGVQLLDSGRDTAKRIVRNHRLVELLMKKTLNINIDEASVCGIEHHMNEEFANALSMLLGNPRKCPHGKDIPK